MTAAHVIVRKDSYHDSVLLMRISRELKALAGVRDAVVAMATPHNRELLAKNGYTSDALAHAGSNDLVIAVTAEGLSAAALEQAVDGLLRAPAHEEASRERPSSLAAAVRAHPEASLVLISLPGEHATREARRALGLGKHVMLFSDNVSVADEIALKTLAKGRGLLMMGPDCGTAIIDGKPLAFANVVRRGEIGIVGAAGTGIQEISSCIHRQGGGISQAIGTGGRDLSEAVGGLMMLFGIEALAADPATRVLCIVSKPPAPAVAAKVVTALERAGKPAVVHFVGADLPKSHPEGLVFADSLAGAAEVAVRLTARAVTTAPAPATKIHAEGRALCGLFCGGTTGHEALALLGRAGLRVRSNLHKKGELRVEGTEPTDGHVLLDLGDDLFTRGRPHPMIDPELRNERLAYELARGGPRLLLFDVVLGFGAHADPAGVLARGLAAQRDVVAIASVTGTDLDPQGYEAQCATLRRAGVIVAPDNRRAAELAARLLREARP